MVDWNIGNSDILFGAQISKLIIGLTNDIPSRNVIREVSTFFRFDERRSFGGMSFVG